VALIVAGVIWSVTQPTCEVDEDCWIGDRCERASGTCVPAPDTAATDLPALHRAPPVAALPTFDAARFALDLGPSTARSTTWQPDAH
jgi:hypothetical protein